MDSSTVFPLVASVLTTTAPFSLTSRAFLPRHLTTTLMLVASPSSGSKSRSLRFAPDVATDMRDSAGDAARARRETDAFRVAPSLDGAGCRSLGWMLGRPPAPARDGGAMDVCLRSIRSRSRRVVFFSRAKQAGDGEKLLPKNQDSNLMHVLCLVSQGQGMVGVGCCCVGGMAKLAAVEVVRVGIAWVQQARHTNTRNPQTAIAVATGGPTCFFGLRQARGEGPLLPLLPLHPQPALWPCLPPAG
jgi:hypothetical protein